MMRPVSRVWLTLWAGFVLLPLLQTGAAQPARDGVILSGREGPACISRAPAVSRVFQLQDHGAGPSAAPLPSTARPRLSIGGDEQSAVLETAPFAVGAAVLPGTYPTGPPELS